MSNSYTNTGTDPLAGAHDTGLYDPNKHDNQIVAMFATEADAQVARGRLVAAGIPDRAIQMTDRAQDRFVGGVDYERRDGGLWGSIRSLFMPDEEAHGYAEGVHRGHAMLVVTPDAAMDRHRIITTLEESNPIDFDAKLEEWRQTGYTHPGYAAGAALGGAALSTGAATDTNALRATDTTAAGTFRNAPSSAAIPTEPTTSAAVRNTQERATETGDVAAARVEGATARAATPATGDTIQVVEERLRVGKREIAKGAVRIRSYVVERPVEEQVRLHDESVQVERRPVDRALAPGENPQFQDRVIEARAVGEEAVVSKTARVVEEIGLHKEATDRVETVRDTVRRTEVDVEGDTTGAPGGATRPTTPGAPTTQGTGGQTTTSTTGATSSGTNAPRK